MVTANKERTAKQTAAYEAAKVDIPVSRLMDVTFYLEQLASLMWEVKAGLIKDVDAKRRREYLTDMFKSITGQDLSQAARSVMSPIERLEGSGLLEQSEAELTELYDAIVALPGMDVLKKKRWLSLIQRTIDVQEASRTSAIAMWTYIGRDSETNAVFQMAPVHRRFFACWADTANRNTLIMAPPGHGKTTCMRGQVIFDICEDPTIRVLICYDSDDKAKKEIGVLKGYFKSLRLQALYPHIWVLGRSDEAEDSRRRFTINRPNIGSREPTVEAAAITSQINGNGYDQIVIDDPCPASVTHQPATRNFINFKWDNEVEQRLRDPKRSRIRMVCTPWHARDLAGHIITQVNQGVRKGWTITVDPFKIKKNDTGHQISLWPERYNSEYYAQQQSRLMPNEYARLFELRCMADQERLVKVLRYYPSDMDDPGWSQLHPEQAEAHLSRLDELETSEQWLSIDPSATAGRSSSETAITQIALTAGGNAYVVDAWFFPGNPVGTQEWLVDKIAAGGIHRILMEAQGGMKGQVVLWEEYILRELKQRGINWPGTIVKVNTQGKGGGANVGKRIRLQNVAAYLERGLLKFPGRMVVTEGAAAAVRFVCSNRDSIQKITDQILDFPAGPCDGVDTISQWIIFNEGRIRQDGGVSQGGVVRQEIFNSLRAGMETALAEARTPQPDGDRAKEQAWMSRRI